MCEKIRSPAPNANRIRKVSNKLNIDRRTEISQKLLISYHTIPYFLPLIKSIKFHDRRRKDCAARTKAIILIKRNTRVFVIWNFDDVDSLWVDRKLSQVESHAMCCLGTSEKGCPEASISLINVYTCLEQNNSLKSTDGGQWLLSDEQYAIGIRKRILLDFNALQKGFAIYSGSLIKARHMWHRLRPHSPSAERMCS